MSEDWPKGWYQNETQAGPSSASEATHGMTFAAPPSGRAGAPGVAPGSGSPGAGGLGGRAGSGWPEQPPQRSEYGQGPQWGRRASGLRRDGGYGPASPFRRAMRRLFPPGK